MPAEQRTIIIVEDEQDAAEMFAEMMRLSGFWVLKAAGSGSAMSMIDKEEPAAVILDIIMPDISGLEVLRYMRREPKMAKNPGCGGLSQKYAHRHPDRPECRGICVPDQAG
jgi:CheY-like chemotaxis protein